jgi:hypothetical protein
MLIFGDFLLNKISKRAFCCQVETPDNIGTLIITTYLPQKAFSIFGKAFCIHSQFTIKNSQFLKFPLKVQ